MENNALIVSVNDLALVTDNSLNTAQLQLLLKKTPAKYVKTRPAKGGGQWEYVTGGYVKKCLNLMFGWDWDFEILEQMVMHKEAIVKGRLTCRTGGKTIIKTQFGNKDIMYRKGTDDPLSIGNDLKAACTDCLKKCASEIGIAADIYNKDEFREMKIEEPDWDELEDLYQIKKESMTADEIKNYGRIIDNREAPNYKKCLTFLKGK